MKYYIGIDLGGTNIVAGVVDEQFRLLAKASDKTRVAVRLRKSPKPWRDRSGRCEGAGSGWTRWSQGGDRLARHCGQ